MTEEKGYTLIIDDFFFPNIDSNQTNKEYLNLNKMIGKKVEREESKEDIIKYDSHKMKENDENVCILCKENKSINEKNKYNILYKCNKCDNIFHLDCLQLIDNESMETFVSRCTLCESLIQNNFENIQRYCHKLKNNESKNKEKYHSLLEYYKKNDDSSKSNISLKENILDKIIKNIKDSERNNKENNDKENSLILNSKICMNMDYNDLINNINNKRNNPSISYPFLFPIPNELFLENSSDKNISKNNSNFSNNQVVELLKKLLINRMKNESIEFQDDDEKSLEMIEKEQNEDIDKYQDEKMKNNINSSSFIKILRDNQYINQGNNLIKKYWSLISNKFLKDFNQRIIKFPISDKELLCFPNMYNIENSHSDLRDKSKNEIGNLYLYPYFNGEIFGKIINIYDLLNTFSDKIYLNKFTLEEFYSALKISEKHNDKEIILLSSIHASIAFIFVNELYQMKIPDIFSHADYDLLLVKIIIDSYYISNDFNELFLFLKYAWPELIRIIFSSRIFNKNFYLYKEIDKNILNKLLIIKNISSYNNIFKLDEKIYILDRLINICYDRPFIKAFIKENQEKKLNLKKKQREYEEELKTIEINKKEIDKKDSKINPEKKLKELKLINEKLGKESKNSEEEFSTIYKKLETNIEKYEYFIKKRDSINTIRKNLILKLEKIKDELFNINLNEKKYLGLDRFGNRYYYLGDKLFIKVKNRNNQKENNIYKYQWKVIKSEKDLKILIDNLNSKGMHENDLKMKLQHLIKIKSEKEYSFLTNYSLEDIFNKNVLNYENNKSPYKEENNFSNKELDFFFIKICNIEKQFSNYLSKYNKIWENEENKLKIKNWLINGSDFKKYSLLLLFLNDKFKTSYKINTDSNLKDYLIYNNSKNINIDNKNISQLEYNNKSNNNINNENKITNINNDKNQLNSMFDEIKNNMVNNIKYSKLEKSKDIKNNDTKKPFENNNEFISNNLFDDEGNLNLNYNNNKTLQTYRIKLWSKDFEPYNLEHHFIKYVNNIQSFPMLFIGISFFESILKSFIYRKELKRKKIINKNCNKNKQNKIKNRIIKQKKKVNEEKIELDDESSDFQEESLIRIEEEENNIYNNFKNTEPKLKKIYLN